MKLTRRQIVIAAAAGSAAAVKAPAQTAPVTPPQDPAQRNADALAKLSIPMTTEPAFQFKA